MAPAALTPVLRSANPVAAAPPVLDQLTLTEFVDRGWYDAHLRTSRRRYRDRRDLLVRALAEGLPACRVAGTAAGLHVLLHLPDGTDAARLVRAGAAAGLLLADLDDYRTAPSADRALVLGYGNLTATEIPTAVTVLRDLF